MIDETVIRVPPAAHRSWRVSPRLPRVLLALMLREMAANQGRSGLGYVWVMLEPLAVIALLSILFALFFDAPALGDSFPLFYATGFLPYQVYAQIQSATQGAILQNRHLLFYPEVGYVDTLLARFSLGMLTQTLSGMVILFAIMWVEGIRMSPDLRYVAISVIGAGFIGFSVGTVNATLTYLSSAWRHIWNVFSRPLFLGSCVFFLFDSLPGWIRDILWYNPLVHMVGFMRKGIYGHYAGEYLSTIYPLGLAGLALVFGLLLLRRFAKDIINS